MSAQALEDPARFVTALVGARLGVGLCPVANRGPRQALALDLLLRRYRFLRTAGDNVHLWGIFEHVLLLDELACLYRSYWVSSVLGV